MTNNSHIADDEEEMREIAIQFMNRMKRTSVSRRKMEAERGMPAGSSAGYQLVKFLADNNSYPMGKEYATQYLKKNCPEIEENSPEIEENSPEIEEHSPEIEGNSSEIEENCPEIEENSPEIEVNINNQQPEPSTADSSPERKSRQNFLLEVRETLDNCLYEHRYHPFLTLAEKQALMLKTKLTYKQVNYWLTNARRRQLIPILKAEGLTGDKIQEILKKKHPASGRIVKRIRRRRVIAHHFVRKR
ncbi:Homeobox KN domain [Trinorchestia longiramus]|nr:Homeobox KN domain [Trinorchestia longiramus]